jgi:hypothetical protein
MATISVIKEQEATDTPIALFEILLAGGGVLRLSTHAVAHEGFSYAARVVRHEPFELKTGGDGSDSHGRLSLTLANADSYFSGIDPAMEWKGAALTVRFCFFDLESGQATSEARIVFRGVCGGAEEITEDSVRLLFHNRLGMQRVWLPAVRVQRSCPWLFPANGEQRQEAVDGGSDGTYSAFYRCGYSAGEAGGVGNLNGGQPFTTCSYTHSDCSARGMLASDSLGHVTRRFGGFPMLPEAATSGLALAPLVYGTGWCEAPVVNVRREGDRVRAEAVAGFGRIEGILKVLVNGYELKESGAGSIDDGSYRLVSTGDREGILNPEMPGEGAGSSGPYGSFAYVQVSVPQSVAPASGRLRIDVLVQGLRLKTYSLEGTELPAFYTNNPVWVLLDVVRRTGWKKDELDLPSFARAAAYCDELVEATDRQNNAAWVPRYRCNLVLQNKRSLAEVIRGLRASIGLILSYSADGKLQVTLESSLATQQPELPAGSNAVATLAGGWPSYEFGDGTAGRSGIARTSQGGASLRLWTRTSADVPNRLSLDYTDEFNQYRRDTLTMVDVDDASRGGQEINGTVSALGVANQSQALRTLQRHLRRSIEGNLFVEFETSVKGVTVIPGSLITVTYLREGLDRALFRVLTTGYSTNLGRIRIVAQKHSDSWFAADVRSLGGNSGARGNGAGTPRPILGTLRNGEGTQFDISESSAVTGDSRVLTILSAAFAVPGTPAGFSAPKVSPVAEVLSGGGTLSGSKTLYYGITAVDGGGLESELSGTVRAALPLGSGFRVKLSGIDLGGAAVMHVYRGTDPQSMQRIATAAPPSDEFVDNGGTLADVLVPPDPNFAEAHFYWRWELQPPVLADQWSTTTIGSSTLSMTANEYSGKLARIVSGTGMGQERTVVANGSTTLTVSPGWSTLPGANSGFVIAEPGWTFAMTSKTSPVSFEVSNRPGATVHVMGRGASAEGVESGATLSPVTRWQVAGDAGSSMDAGSPPVPGFGLGLAGRGTVELAGVAFQTLTNTRSISSGTLTLHYWNEISGAGSFALAAGIGASDTTLNLTAPGTAQVGDMLQLGSELLEVAGASGTQYQVVRGKWATLAQIHSVGASVLHLNRRVEIVAFPSEFFGSPASGSYAYVISLPNARIAGAEFFVTNSKGISPTRQQAYTGTADGGLRTLSGGQYSIQVEGLLAIQNGAAPGVVVEDAHSVRDVYARVKQAPTGSAVQMIVRQNGAVYCNLTIAPGATISNVVNGANAGPLQSQALLTLDVTSVGTGASDFPGQDLTVTIRL